MKSSILALAGCAIAAIPVQAAWAQSDPMQMARVMNANQVGLMEYCQGKGWVNQDAVDSQKKAAADLPAGTDSDGVTAAETAGKSGNLMNNGTPMALSAMARQSNTTEQALCGQMAASAKMAAQQSGALTAVPGMPAGMAIPGIPGATKP